MNRSELRTRVLSGLNESTSSPVHFSTTQIDATITEALEILAEEVEAVKRTVFVPLREGATYYFTQGIATDMMIPYRLWTPTNNRRLIACSIHELDEFSEVWNQTTGDPEAWFPICWDTFGIYPYPTTAGGLIRIDYLAWPRELLDDSDEPELPEATHESVVDYCIYDGLMKRYDTETAIRFLNKFASLFKDAKARSGINRKGSQVFQRVRKPQADFPTEIGDRGV